MPENPLAAAAGIWRDARRDLEAAGGGEVADGCLVPPAELKKIALWLQQATTKFGASAAVAEGQEREQALPPVAKEVMDAFQAAVGTILAMRNGAGTSLMAELNDVGGGLAESLEAMGGAVSPEAMAAHAGKALERAKNLERMSTNNRAAIRRRLLSSLAQLRDAHRELSEALECQAADDDTGEMKTVAPDSDGESLAAGSDMPLDEDERPLVQAVQAVAISLEEALGDASFAVVPSTPGGGSVGGSLAAAAADSTPVSRYDDDPRSLVELEKAAAEAAVAVNAVDGLASSSMGGLDVEAFTQSLTDLRSATAALTGSIAGASLAEALDRVQEAFDAAPKD